MDNKTNFAQPQGFIRQADDPVFARQFDGEGRMRILDGMRYYKKTATQNNMPRFVVKMDEPVDPECLQYAAEMSLGRFRVHSFIVVHDETRFYLKQNTEKPVVHYEDGKQHVVSTEENHGYMTRISYHDRTIYVEVFHGVTDGGGTTPFIRTLLYYYCEKKYGNAASSLPGLILADTPEDPREYADSMLFLTRDTVTPGDRYAYESALRIPGPQMASECACKYYELYVDAEAFESYMRSNASSRSAVFSVFMNRAIASFHDVSKAPIVAALAVDARRAYGALPTMQCCVATVPLWYDTDIEALPVSEQLKRTRQMILDGVQPESILVSALRTKKLNEMMEDKFPSLEEKQAFARKVNKEGSSKYTYGISYVGELKFGSGIDAHVENCFTILCANTIPIIIEIVKYKSRYHISYCTHLEDDRYVHRLQALFVAAGIPCTCEQKQDFIETIADF